MYLSFALLLAFASLSSAFGKSYRVVVKGQLMCPSDPGKAKGITLKLFPTDDSALGAVGNIGKTIATQSTDKNGSFSLDGTASGYVISSMSPHLQIYHNCNDGWKPCKRHLEIGIPSNYVYEVSDNKLKPFDLGILNLEAIMPGEERSCLGSIGKRSARLRRHHRIRK